MQYGDRARVDVVTTRTEFYDSPGALPTVERAGLREDLFRRDFTINAMAASLSGSGLRTTRRPARRPGRPRQRVSSACSTTSRSSTIPPGSSERSATRRDTGSGSTSTRRGWRGAASRWASSVTCRPRASATSSWPSSTTRARWRASCGSASSAPISAIHPRLRADDEAAALFERRSQLRDELGLEVPAWRIGLAVLGRDLTSDEAYDWLERLDVRRRDVHRIAGVRSRWRRASSSASEMSVSIPRTSSSLADPYAPDAPLLALALAELPELRDYFTRLRNVRLEIDGADLAALGLRRVAARRRGARRASPAEAQRRARRA